jgi:hypothetical protein
MGGGVEEMWSCGGVKMWRCGGVEVWRCGGEDSSYSILLSSDMLLVPSLWITCILSNSIILYLRRLPYPSIHTVFSIFLCCGFVIPYLINLVNGFALRFEIFKCNPLSCIGTARI